MVETLILLTSVEHSRLPFCHTENGAIFGAKFGHCSHFRHNAVVLDENQVLCSKLYEMNTLNIDASHSRLSMHVTSYVTQL